MATFAERLNEALLYRNMSAAELSRRLGVSEGTISCYKKGLYEPKQRRTEKIANILHVSISWLIGADDVPMTDKSPGTLIPLSNNNVFLRPLYDSVAAGLGVPAENTIVGYIPTYIQNAIEKEKYIWVNVQGDSMAPKIENGDKILIKLQDSVDSGQIAVVLIDGEQAVVKRVNYGADYIELISFNPYYPPRRFENEEVLRIHVVGLVKEVNKTLAQ